MAKLIQVATREENAPSAIVDPALLKATMRTVSAAVSIITAGVGQDRTGATVTSATALSLEPPTMIVNINRTSSTFPIIRRHGHFCVNILADGHETIANRFAGVGGVKGEARYDGATWTTRASGAPVLAGALATIDCEVEEIIERHSHGIILGRVLDIVVSEGCSLVYHNGCYGSFAPRAI